MTVTIDQIKDGGTAVLVIIITTVHTIWSQPAPQAIAVPEIIIAFGLLLLVGVAGPARVLSGIVSLDRRREAMMRLASAGFLMLLWSGLVRGVALGWPSADILRNVIPLLFLFMPLLIPATRLRTISPELLACLLAIGGGCFAVRFLIGTDLPVALWGRVTHPLGLDYLANSPLLGFAACYGLLLPIAFLLRLGGNRLTLLNVVMVLVLFVMAVLAWMAMGTAAQRAPLGLCLLTVLAGCLVLACAGIRQPGGIARLSVLAVLAVAAGLSVAGDVLTVVPALVEKSRLVGDNARLAEWSAIWTSIAWRLDYLILGHGWGAHYASPAVGDYWVGYAHGLIAYIPLKAGLIGFACLLAYLLAIGWYCFRGWVIADLPMRLALIACLPPLLTGLLFYTSYKYLGFGLLLLLIWRIALGAQPRQTGRFDL